MWKCDKLKVSMLPAANGCLQVWGSSLAAFALMWVSSVAKARRSCVLGHCVARLSVRLNKKTTFLVARRCSNPEHEEANV
ncbi:hypothetical protein LY76DRAFT_579955 [Colletotrichum caudatum]|nr:hypothetical protein LY76DRAFT_579955 [Colletotrichum caudatum]